MTRTLDLAGTWQIALDREDRGVSDDWPTRSFSDTLQLPGSLQAQGFGDDPGPDTPWTANVMDRSWWTSPDFAQDRTPGSIRLPFWLTPRKHYVGVAWYRREVEVPADWAGQRCTLLLERVHWGSRLWIDGHEVGACDSLSAPHTFDLTGRLSPGRHALTLRIDNRMLVDVGNWAHSVSDHTQTNWNGVIGRLELNATSPAAIAAIRTWPDIATRSVRVEVEVVATQAGRGTVRIGDISAPVAWTAAGGSVSLHVPLGPQAALWDEYHPTLHRLEVRLSGDQADDARSITVGLREVGRSPGRMLTINGHEILLRGTLECCIFPDTGYPPTDRAAWERIYAICRAHGLNHLRFHSWCPPEVAFDVADALGFYLQVEVNAWCHIGRGQPIDDWVLAESERLVAAHGNHPSLILLMIGNEMLPYAADAERDRYLAAWSEVWVARDARRLYAGSTLTASVDGDQVRVSSGTYGASTWATGTYRSPPTALPHVVHEMGQYCAFPDLRLLDRPAGFLAWSNLAIFRDRLRASGLGHHAGAFLDASGRLQALCYKEDIEAVLRASEPAGYQLLDLRDFPGQGTALVGVLDAYWNPKGYISAVEYRRFAGATVPLATLPRVLTDDQQVEVPLGASHFGPEPLTKVEAAWSLRADDGRVVAAGVLPRCDLPRGRTPDLGRIALGPLVMGRYRLELRLSDDGPANDWPIEVVPAQAAIAVPDGVRFATTADQDLLAWVAAGGTAVLCAADLGHLPPPGAFVPVFWNRQWFPSQRTTTLGLLTDPRHPALAAFPSAGHTTWLWKDVVETASCLPVAGWPDTAVIVRWIDDWNTSRSLALVAECRLGAGRLVIAACDAVRDLAQRPATRQLVRSLLAYAASPACAPQHQLGPDAARTLLLPGSPAAAT
jgi:beta-galactosidase